MSDFKHLDDLPTTAERYPHGLPMEQHARLVAFFDALGLEGEWGIRCIKEAHVSVEDAVRISDERRGRDSAKVEDARPRSRERTG